MADLLAQIEELDKQRQKLVEQAHDEAYKKAEEAIEQLNALGYNYRISGGAAKAATAPTGTRTRRTGIRDDVLKTISTRNGMAPAEIASTLGMEDKAGKQAIANALSALKKADKVTVDEGKYRVNSG